MNVKITRMNKLNKGTLKAFCDVEFTDIGLVVCDVKIAESKSGTLFAGMPSREYEHEGQKKYRNLVAFPSNDVYSDVQKSIMAAYNAYREEPPAPQEYKLPDSNEIFADGLPF